MAETDPVLQQPGNAGTPEKLPAGLAQLYSAAEITVKQHIDSVEVVVCCCVRPNRYSVYAGDSDEQCLYVQEVSDCYARQITGAARGFKLKFGDNDLVDTIHLLRPQTCSRGCCCIFCCCCSLPSLKIQTPPGNTVATVTERRTCLCPVYEVTNPDGQVMYTIQPSCCYSWLTSLLSDIHIPIYDADGSVVAELVKKTKMKISECVGQANDFSVKYLTEMTVRQKVALLGAVFLLDFHYFERQNRCCC